MRSRLVAGFDLIHAQAVPAAPIAPLGAINSAQIPMFVSPFVPDGDAVFVQIANVRIATQKPKQLVNDRFDVQFFCGE